MQETLQKICNKKAGRTGRLFVGIQLRSSPQSLRETV